MRESNLQTKNKTGYYKHMCIFWKQHDSSDKWEASETVFISSRRFFVLEIAGDCEKCHGGEGAQDSSRQELRYYKNLKSVSYSQL